jgi:hypothetical protein
MKSSCHFLLNHSETHLHSAKLKTELPESVSNRELIWLELHFKKLKPVSQSKSHIAADSESVSKFWCRVPSGAHAQIFVTVWQLRSSFSVAPSLTRVRVCLLYMLLVLASAVFLVSESLGIRNHILISQIWGFLLRLLIRLEGSRWRYSIQPPHGVKPLQLLLVLATAIILGSESHGTRDHILVSQIRDSPNLDDQIPIFISPRIRVAQLYPQALCSFFVASYDSKGYGGNIRTSLHTVYWILSFICLLYL